MLNPIANHHGASLMIAIGNVWGEKRKKSRIFQDHKVIIELVRSLKSFPISTIVQNITEILKQSNQNSNKDKVSLNIFIIKCRLSLSFFFNVKSLEKESYQRMAFTIFAFIFGLSEPINFN